MCIMRTEEGTEAFEQEGKISLVGGRAGNARSGRLPLQYNKQSSSRGWRATIAFNGIT